MEAEAMNMKALEFLKQKKQRKKALKPHGGVLTMGTRLWGT